ncbi:uL13 family ribosomal protein [Candidatus Vidania fulgoroideorum]
MEKYTFKNYNLKKKKIGRICSLIANDIINYSLLKIKHRIIISNYSKVIIKEKEVFYKHSGYPGGLKKITTLFFVKKHGFNGLITKTIEGMLPKNRFYKKNIFKSIVFK